MKQSMHVKLSQHLTLTPQLQQAIRLLQLSTLDLNTEVQDALDRNPLLEVPDDSESEIDLKKQIQSLEPAERSIDMEHELLPNDLPVDSVWDDFYQNTFSRQYNLDELPQYEGQYNSQHKLHDFLMWQIDFSHYTSRDRAIAVAIIDAISEDGYLKSSLEEISQTIGLEEPVDPEEIEIVLRQIQHYDPPGIGARTLQECILIQLNQLPDETPFLEQAKTIVMQYMDLLADHDFKHIMQKCHIDDLDLRQAIHLIQSLNPRPGNRITDEEPQYTIPDVIVRRRAMGWFVELNPETLPKIRINPVYAEIASKSNGNGSDNQFLKGHLQEAKWFIKSLQSRHDTLLKVAKCIVEKQRDFLEYGEEAMRPLILHDVAEELEMHESTISRITTQKFIHTPRGIFELKFFFSSHVATQSGGECSSTAIRALIKKLIGAENPVKPLSDSKIAQFLLGQGIKVARRTVAKYREAMSIPASNERKQLM